MSQVSHEVWLAQDGVGLWLVFEFFGFGELEALVCFRRLMELVFCSMLCGLMGVKGVIGTVLFLGLRWFIGLKGL